MKHSYTYLFVLLGIFFFACTTDFEEVAVNDDSKVEEGQLNYSASQKAALAELTYMLNTMDSVSQKTRGYSASRKIKNIDVVRNTISGTRSNGIDTLLFLVNFEDEKGYAILGANDNYSDVIAIVDNGNLSVNEFLFPQYNSDEVEAHFLYEHIFNYALKKCVANSAEGATRAAKGYPGPRQFLHQRFPMLTTTWHQREPYNVLCPIKDGKNCVAGCVAIAVAQVVAYNKLTYGKGPKEIASYKLDWDGILQAMKDPESDTYAVATLIRAVGKAVSMKYGLDASSSNITNAMYAFANMGVYSNLERHNYTGNNAHTMVFDRGFPAYVRGDGYLADGSKSAGHAWVVDGIIKYDLPIYDKPYNIFDPDFFMHPPKLIGMDDDYVVHCNFGWKDGQCNGHYNTGVFDLIDGAVELDPGSSTGWIAQYKEIDMIMSKMY